LVLFWLCFGFALVAFWLCFGCVLGLMFLAGEPQRSLVLQKMLRHEHVRPCSVRFLFIFSSGFRFCLFLVVIGALSDDEWAGVERQRVSAQRVM
jgi:hypothetical protein